MATIMRDKFNFSGISCNICLFVLIFSLIWVFPLATTASASPPEVVPAARHDESPPMSVVPFLPPQAAFRAIPLLPVPHPAAPAATDPVLQGSAGSSVQTSSSGDILGVGNGFSNFNVSSIPPDTNGAVGATQYVQWVNTSFAVFNKTTGDVELGPVPGNALWSGFGGPCETQNSGDPIAQYDKAANRWIMLQPVFKSPYSLCVAVSATSDATGQYYRYQFSIPGRYFPDYPKLGVWPDGYYVTYNQFKGGRFIGAAACALDRSAMLNGNAATMQCENTGSSYGSLLPADLDGSTPPPTGSPEYFLNFGTNSLNLWTFQVDFATPSNSIFTGPTGVQGVKPFSMACGGGTCIPQAGTNQKLDSLGDRLMYRLAYRNFGTYAAMVVNHSVDTGNGNTGIRWYELRRPDTSGASFSVYQQGTYSPDYEYRWMGSIAMDHAGDIALGYSVSGNDMSPEIRYTGRVPSDNLGDMEGETTIVYGGSQTNYSRWGDYSSMTVDPTDDCTFWYTNEYQPVTGYYWSTRIAHFTFDNCSATSVTAPAAPTGLSASVSGSNVNLAWNNSTGATSYNVLRGTQSGSYSQIASGIGITSYTDSGLADGTYYYVVQAANSGGTSGDSDPASATVCVTPSTPTGLSAVAGDSQVTLTWTVSSGATGYHVWSSTSSSGPYSSTSTSGTSYTDTGLNNGTTYYYEVSAYNTCGESANSLWVSATPSATTPPTITAAPTNLTSHGAKRKVNLSWTQSTTSGVTQNTVYRSTTSGGGYTPIATISATTSYSDRTASSGKTYYYVVTATSGAGESAYSNETSASPR